MLNFIKVLTDPAIKAGTCVEQPYGCGQPTNGFTSELSQKEYLISGLCQKCQDKVFNEPDDFDSLNDMTPEDRIAYQEFLIEQAEKDLKDAIYAELRLLNDPNDIKRVFT